MRTRSSFRKINARILGLALLCSLSVPWAGHFAPAAAQTLGELVVEAYSCPDSATESIANIAECVNPLSGAVVTLEQNGLQIPQASASGSTTWFGGVPIGFARLGAQVQGPYTYAEAQCSSGGLDVMVYPATASPPFYTFDLNIPEGSFYRCAWYFVTLVQAEQTASQIDAVPTETPSTADSFPIETAVVAAVNGNFDKVGMTVYACSDGMPTDASVETILMECTQPAQGIPYYIEPELEVPGRTDGSGFVYWERTQAEGGEIKPAHDHEYVQTRYLECASYPTESRPEAYVPWNGGTQEQAQEIAYPGDPGVSFDCRVYVQATGARLEFQTWQCTDAFDPEGDLNAARSNPDICQSRTDWNIRADRELENGTGQQVNLTSFTSMVDWPTGRVTFALDAPDYQQYVHCEYGEWYQWPDQNWGDKPDDPGLMRYDLQAGAMIACEWFAVPLNGETLPTAVADQTADNGSGGVDPTADPGGYGLVRFVKYECPEDPGDSYDDFYQNCPGTVGGVTFDVYRSGVPEIEITTDDSGYGQTGEIPAGLIGLAERIPPTGAAWYPRVFCGDYQAGSGGPSELIEYPLGDPNMVMLDLRLDYIFICEWFNIPYDQYGSPSAEAAGYGSIRIHKYACGLFNSLDMSFETLSSLCSNNVGGAGFTFEMTDTSLSSATGNDGIAAFDSVPAGLVTVEEVIAGTGYRTLKVFCDSYAAGGFVTSVDEMPVGGHTERPAITAELLSGYVLECYWFNQTDPDAAYPLVVVKFMCPAGYDPTIVSPDDLAANCRREYGTELSIADGSGYSATAYTGTDGYAYWDQVPYGPLRVQESESANYKIAWARCAVYPRSEGPGEYLTQMTDGLGFDVSVSPGDAASCEIYNVWTGTPEDYETGYGLIWINKFVCPADGNIYPGSNDNIAEECSEQQVDILFRAFRNDSSIEPVDFVSGISSAPVPNGPVSIVETVPDGYRVHRVFCTQYPNKGMSSPKEEMAVFETEQGAYIETSLRAGYVIMCDWYNRPYRADETPVSDPTYYPTPDDGFEGAEDYTPTYTVEPPYNYTPTPTWQAEYTATATYSPDYTPTYPPDYTPTYPADYTPTYPPEYTPTYVATATYTPTLDNGGPPLGQTYTPTPQVVGGDQPTASPTAAIVIYKVECPAGYEPTSGSSDPELACDRDPGEVQFRLFEGDDELAEEQLNPDDTNPFVRFDDLESGVYTVQELPNDPVDSAFIGGCLSNVRSFGEYAFLPYVLVTDDGRVTLRLLEGEELTCYWYNVPRAEGTVSMSVYVCPGQTANPARCDQSDVEIDVSLIPDDEGEPVNGTSDEDGLITLEALAGSYDVDIDGDPACLIDSVAVDDRGKLIVRAGEEVKVDAYLCSAP